MKATITQRERLRVAEWITDARQLLAGVEEIERHIAATLGLAEHDQDVISDAIGIPTGTVDHLLTMLGIDVDEEE